LFCGACPYSITETHHVCNPTALPCPAATTIKWYDGEDRLVEVQQPHDPTYDVYTFAWFTRYIYDIGAEDAVSITGGTSGFQAYGNLYKTQECLSGTSVTINGAAGTVTGGCTFQDVRGNTFDALDRSLTKVEVATGSAPEATRVYDANGNEGLVAEKITGTNQSDTLSYDADGHTLGDTFNDGTPNRTYVYDPDGHATSLTSATLGTETRTYDADGRMIQRSEAGNIPDAGVMTYSYYGDGLRKNLALQIAATGYYQPNLFEYNYRTDGLRSSLLTTLPDAAGTFAWTYSNAGRELTESDPATGLTVTANMKQPLTFQPTTYTYDAYGRISLFTAPTGLTEQPSWDPENHDWEQNKYTVRGELQYQPTGTSMYAFNTYAANGVLCTTCTIDARSGSMQSLTTTLATPTSSVSFQDQYGYDAAGRQITDVEESCTTPSQTLTRSYDAENHLAIQTFPTVTCTAETGSAWTNGNITNSWGPNGHLATQLWAYNASGSTPAGSYTKTMPSLRTISATGVPASACRNAAAICSGEWRLRTGKTSG
jgi:hypothetical protein